MNYTFWKQTGLIKPFASVEEFEEYTKDLCKLPKVDPKRNTPLNRSKVRKGINARSESFDSFSEFIFVTYMRTIKQAIVERNHKSHFLLYQDPKGKTCKFFPDFMVGGLFYEIKGRVTEKDACKMSQHPEVQWYFQSDIEMMKKELDSHSTNWRDDFIQTN
jgi:hypothetical protein